PGYPTLSLPDALPISVLKAGHLSISSSRYDLTSYGHSVGLLADTFYFVYRPLNGDGEIVAKLDSFNASGKNAQAGLMIRESSWRSEEHTSELQSRENL